MYHLDPRPYPRLTAEQKDNMLGEVAPYLAVMDWCRSGRQARDFVDPSIHTPVTTEGEQLELFPPGTSERLERSILMNVYRTSTGERKTAPWRKRSISERLYSGLASPGND